MRIASVDLSFIVLTWNSERYLERCLGSVYSALEDGPFSYEILILDNGSSDRTPVLLSQLAEESRGRLLPYFQGANTGTTRARNRLLAASRGDYVCVMDSDVELRSGVLDVLIPLLERDSSLGIVAPGIVYPHGAWQKSFDRFPTLGGKIERFFRLRQIERQQARQIGGSTSPFYVDYAISAFWLFRRNLLSTVGALDEQIFFAPEDVDFCLRVWKSGLRILYVPSVSVVHHAQEMTRGWRPNKAKLQHIQGLAYYFLKHRYLFRRPRFMDMPETGKAT